MKKFVFTLQYVLDYSIALEKTQKAELRKAQEALNKLLARLEELEEAYRQNCSSLTAAIERGINLPYEMSKHDDYFKYLRAAKAELMKKIEVAEKERDKCMEKLVSTMKRIKVYSKLRQEQYQAYLHEVKLEEEKEIGDIVSFNVISEEAETT
ncbi:MAG: flagellar export protein FliJ [Clostridiales bacterium]|jgi:flagellar export protein FliJ|nr:flagellar export protein FliJ [Clostridiales bacterium]